MYFANPFKVSILDPSRFAVYDAYERPFRKSCATNVLANKNFLRKNQGSHTENPLLLNGKRTNFTSKVKVWKNGWSRNH